MNTPERHPHHLPVPETTVFDALAVSAARYPSRTAVRFYGRSLSYAQLLAEAQALAGHLQARCGVQRGDRVVLYLQNSPQFVVAYHAVLRADAVVVPVNPMNLTDEVAHVVRDSEARVAVVGAELRDRVLPLLRGGDLRHVVTAAYGEYADPETDLPLPDVVKASWPLTDEPGCVTWRAAITAGDRPRPAQAGPGDLAALAYTSGTTGAPKGCMHTHRSLMAIVAAAGVLNGQHAGDVMLAVTPFFHITGMQMVMNNAVYLGATMVVMTRWDREAALRLIREEGVTSWINIPTMVIDLLGSPNADEAALSSLRHIGGGGAAMPEPVALRLKALTGFDYIEGYGLTETAAPTHSNPLQGPKRQCLGLPICNTESLIRDPDSGDILPPGTVGEIVSSGPQVFAGYWRQAEATAAAFVEIDGKRFFRTGDLGQVDDEGYFFLVDRLKRMINASGFKVWPAEVESLLFAHPDVQEACVIAGADAHRGETVKACIVLKAGRAGTVTETQLIEWARAHMAAYKVPRVVTFVDQLPKTGTGKVQWRLLQERERVGIGSSPSKAA
jgi:fatty-acyl-CoA synthase